MEINKLKVALVQMSSLPGDVKSNGAKIKQFIEQAAAQNADILITPELSNVGYNLSILGDIGYNFQLEKDYYSALARQFQMVLAIAMLEEDNGVFYNTLQIFGTDGSIISSYRKINLFPLSKESKVFKSGSEPCIIKLGGFKIGASICYDIRFPELFQNYMENDCDILLVSSAFPFPRLEHWNILLKAHAVLNQAYVVASNMVGKNDKLQFVGNSCVIDPWGVIDSSLNDIQEGLIIQMLDLDKVSEVRNKIPAIADRKIFYNKANIQKILPK